MFLKLTKDFILKKTLKKNLKNLDTNFSTVTIKKVGLLVDSACFLETEKLIQELILYGIKAENITTIVCSEKIKSIEKPQFNFFSGSQLSWNGTIMGDQINYFVSQKFDLLINYYDIEKAVLLNITHNSNALFKVGFPDIDNRFNHFIINTAIGNHIIYIKELFKYLKLLNKL
jgi:hypothetical protein